MGLGASGHYPGPGLSPRDPLRLLSVSLPGPGWGRGVRQCCCGPPAALAEVISPCCNAVWVRQCAMRGVCLPSAQQPWQPWLLLGHLGDRCLNTKPSMLESPQGGHVPTGVVLSGTRGGLPPAPGSSGATAASGCVQAEAWQAFIAGFCAHGAPQ